MPKAVVIGSGAGGSFAAMEFARAGWEVVVFEKGPNHFSNLGGQGPIGTVFANDSLAMVVRNYPGPDPEVFPRTWRPNQASSVQYTGSVDELPQVVGGGTVHWDAKIPRFWDIDFAQLSALGPVPGADLADWPFSYAEIAPFYDEVEQLIGAQGDTQAFPDIVKKHAPRQAQYPMPPGPQMRSSMAVAAGATAIGLHPFPFPMAINSAPYNDQHVCNNCGFCSTFGCPVVARPAALIPLRQALRTGRVRLVPETMVTKVLLSGSGATERATGVQTIQMTERGPVTATETADVVVMAASAIETVRLALLSQFPDRSGKLGRRLMLHAFVDGTAIFLDERMHAYRGRSITQCAEDAADPDFPGARAFAKAHGLPYLRGGLMELGGSQDPISEAQSYQTLLGFLRSTKPFGTDFKALMRSSILRDRLAGCQIIGHDLPYLGHTVTLDPKVRDVFGLPVAQVTWSYGKHEQVAQQFWIPRLKTMMTKAGAGVALAVPATENSGGLPTGNHVMGGMMMGTNPATSVTDAYGRVHGLDNVYVADGSVFVTSGAHNPTNTIMAVALRNMRHLAGGADMEWTGQVYADCPVVAAQIDIEAPPERVWGMVSDIFLMPELSSELREVAWLDGVAGPAVGRRFTGRNAHPAMGEWETVSTVVACDPPRCFAWAVGDPGHPSATWRFTLRPAGTGTLLEQWYQMGPARSGLNIAIDAMPDKEAKIVFVRLREHETGMKHNLEAIKERVER